MIRNELPKPGLFFISMYLVKWEWEGMKDRCAGAGRKKERNMYDRERKEKKVLSIQCKLLLNNTSTPRCYGQWTDQREGEMCYPRALSPSFIEILLLMLLAPKRSGEEQMRAGWFFLIDTDPLISNICDWVVISCSFMNLSRCNTRGRQPDETATVSNSSTLSRFADGKQVNRTRC